MTIKEAPSRLRAEINELAQAMLVSGTLDKATYEKITARALKSSGTVPVIENLSNHDIRQLRESVNMSQAAFARHLNLTTSYIAQLERGTRRPTGASLLLLNVIRRKGIQAIV